MLRWMQQAARVTDCNYANVPEARMEAIDQVVKKGLRIGIIFAFLFFWLSFQTQNNQINCENNYYLSPRDAVS